MKILLDTHVILWALEDSPRLPLNIRDLILDEKNEIYISTISLWEIAIKHKKQPNSMPYDATSIRDYCQKAGYIFLSLSIDNVAFYEKYDFSMHQDPFDQMLVAQSATSNMKLVTHDSKLKLYNVGFIEVF